MTSKRAFLLYIILSISSFALATEQNNCKIADWACFKGVPKAKDNLTILKNSCFIVGYSENRKNPDWVCYSIGKSRQPSAKRPSFKSDPRTAAQVVTRDYTNSGYDRGHMAPNHAIATRYGIEAQEETFLLSNICPQTPELNRQAWKDLEQLIAKEYYKEYGRVWIITGPIYDDDKDCLSSGIEIPDAFYKIVVDVDEEAELIRTQAFIFPQRPTTKKLSKFLTTINDIETKTGIDFFHELSDDYEEQIESKKAKTVWRLVKAKRQTKTHSVPIVPAFKKKPSDNSNSSDITVYVTKSGKKYHRGSCSYLRRSKIPISKTDAQARGYSPCSRCSP